MNEDGQTNYTHSKEHISKFLAETHTKLERDHKHTTVRINSNTMPPERPRVVQGGSLYLSANKQPEFEFKCTVGCD